MNAYLGSMTVMKMLPVRIHRARSTANATKASLVMVAKRVTRRALSLVYMELAPLTLYASVIWAGPVWIVRRIVAATIIRHVRLVGAIVVKITQVGTIASYAFVGASEMRLIGKLDVHLVSATVMGMKAVGLAISGLENVTA